ncbi:ATP-binding response regulator [Cohnella sp. JJ-181]|uniref:ATP-binding response regulator n=1 Tax=Cohnella rhizoplanae TaxID=2974897 RepID=UPI0022FF89FC|nr:ATP-binding protein [Cohnella sp. JJ-181]CAI6086662.1 Sensor histidine kinase RcsC [Cohnella sp. JJ-181]
MGERVHILLVDDRPDEYLSIQAILADTPYKLVCAPSGAEALKYLLKTDFALIIMDVLMPDMDGFETARRIKTRKRSQDIPIIFLTALTSELDNYKQAYSAGAIDFITKPVHTEVLKSKIDGFVRLYLTRLELERQAEELAAKTQELEAKTVELEAKTVQLEDQARRMEEANRELTQLKDIAETASKIKSGFLAMMSHELRTPLNGIIAMSELLMDAELRPADRDMVDIIRTSGTALLSIISHILDFSKIESGKMELELTPFNLGSCLKETTDLFIALLREKELTLTTDIDPAIPSLLLGDPNRLRQVLNNLIGNAVKFTPSGGVRVSAKMLARQRQQLELEFTVEDTGIGIPEGQHYRLFQPFSQLGGTQDAKTGGTGLGLAICKTLVELMGGRIYAKKDVARGAAFVFTMMTSPV